MKRSLAAITALSLIGGGALVAVPLTSTEAAPANQTCSSQFLIDETMATGTRWSMCFEPRNTEGIVWRGVNVALPGSPQVSVLNQINLAQLHVPYDDNGARYHDETDYGLGGTYLDNLTAADCPGGQLRQDGSGKNVLCVIHENRGYAYKSYASQVQGEDVKVFFVAHIGAYNYVIGLRLLDSGAFAPFVGASGRLQRYGTDPNTGWQVRTGSSPYAVAHTHNYYWRMDFDLGATPNDDVVEEMASTPGAARDTWTKTVTAFTNEVARQVSADTFRTWRVRDSVANAEGHLRSYEIMPESSMVFRGPSYEPWTTNEFYVTKYNACEQYVSHNSTAGGCGADLPSFVNGESLSGQDSVVWYGTSFHHLPSDEDDNVMHSHWTEFTVKPRDLTGTNPLENVVPTPTTSTTTSTTTTSTIAPTTTTTDPNATTTTSTTTTTTTSTTTSTTVAPTTTTAPSTGTRTFTSASAVTIPDSGSATPYPARIDVAGMGGTVNKVTVSLKGITHTYSSDLDVLLVSPTGAKTLLMSDVGGSSRLSGATITFDAAAAASIGTTSLVAGTYRPTDNTAGDAFASPAPAGPYTANLANVNGIAANGSWMLYVVDDAAADSGSVAQGWTITITTV